MEPCESTSPEHSSERGKLFVGGISSETGEEVLREHFAKYGEIEHVVVIRDRLTGNGRGFAFVQFADPDSGENALDEKETDKHVILGRTVEVKRAIPRTGRNQYGAPMDIQYVNPTQNLTYDNTTETNIANNNNPFDPRSRKIFVGGLRDNITDSELRAYFEKFGTMNDAVVMIDKWTKRSRGFGFVTFDSDESVRKVMETPFHELNGRTVEVKIAVPKGNHGNNTSDSNNYNNEGECDNGDGCYVPRMFGARGGPAFGAYFGGVYPPYGRFFNGYAASPVPPYMYPGNYAAAVGSYGSVVYGGLRAPWMGGSGMIARRGPMMPYRDYGAYFGYMNNGGGVLGGYMGVNGNGAYYGNGGTEDAIKTGCVDPDVPATVVNGVGAVVPQLEAVKLDAQ
ncbi:hypothetical protein LUZ61_009815 [Rhynchospora tenuis]|uniref:RRM domain-containing protein n=1 Tax=Rhynchospora tenuis TaxID=198213 RepID=A0AAD5ZY01_9POAL|nr:hypothetical protein LUZ61_009815 [Rhynchospora tenuis]